MPLSFTAIRRNPLYSPGHVDNDARILAATASRLQELGHSVEFLDETHLNGPVPAAAIFAMCQSRPGIDWLFRMEQLSKVIVNRPQAILNCYRTNLIRILAAHGIPIPDSQVVSTADPLPLTLAALVPSPGLWIKRGDAHATQRGDVVRVSGLAEANEALQGFRDRGIAQAVVQSHIQGTLLKFYAVRDSSFFRSFSADRMQVPGLDESRFQRIAQDAARALGLDVFGGDVILTSSGGIVVIDINDWPSFAPCREEAAGPIAERILARALTQKDSTE
jgi:hypothetical protein